MTAVNKHCRLNAVAKRQASATQTCTGLHMQFLLLFTLNKIYSYMYVCLFVLTTCLFTTDLIVNSTTRRRGQVALYAADAGGLATCIFLSSPQLHALPGNGRRVSPTAAPLGLVGALQHGRHFRHTAEARQKQRFLFWNVPDLAADDFSLGGSVPGYDPCLHVRRPGSAVLRYHGDHTTSGVGRFFLLLYRVLHRQSAQAEIGFHSNDVGCGGHCCVLGCWFCFLRHQRCTNR